MRNRIVNSLMILLMLLHPVTSLASACVMPGDTAQAPTVAMTASDIENASHDQPPHNMSPSCHEEAAPESVEPNSCRSCTGGLSCATACSVMSSSLTCDYHSAIAARPDINYAIITPAIIPPSPFELYRPPRLG